MKTEIIAILFTHLRPQFIEVASDDSEIIFRMSKISISFLPDINLVPCKGITKVLIPQISMN